MKLPTVRWNFVSIPERTAQDRYTWMTAHTFRYQHGEFLRQTFTCKSEGNSVQVGFGAREGSYTPWWKTVEVVIYGWPSAQADATLSNNKLKTTYDAPKHALHILMPDSGKETELRVSGH